MKKSILRNITACLLLLAAFAVPTLATEYMSSYLSDSAGFLTDEQAQTLDSALEQTSEELTAYIRIATEKNMSASSAEKAANDYYDYFNDNGDGYLQGVLLYVSSEPRSYYVTASDNVFNDDMITALEDAFLPYLREDDYYGAFEAYLAAAEEQITEYHGKTPSFPIDPYPQDSSNENFGAIDDYNETLRPTDLIYLIFNPYVFVIVLVIPLLIALFVTHLKVKQMNTVEKKTTASGFVKQDSLKINEAHEIFLYSTVVATPKPKDNDNHHDSGFSGGSSGGGSGRVGHGGSY